MDRLACVDVAALPLQLLLRAHPEWKVLPTAVVAEDRPQGLVQCINGHARARGVRRGHRYATALVLARDLRASTVSPLEIQAEVLALTERLRRFSPHVEPSTDMPGVFWLDVHGLGRLYPTQRAWANAVHADLHDVALTASIALGFSRFGVHALALSHRGTVICATVEDERARVQRVPIARLHFDPDARDRLLALGITTVGEFLRLPGDGIRTRFGADAAALHRLASGERWAPLVPAPPEVRHECAIDFDAPERSVERLLFVLKRLLDGLAVAIHSRRHAIVEIVLRMTLDDRTTREEHVRPAAATLDITQLLTLVRLRLDTLQLPAGIVSLHVTAGTCPAASDQSGLFPDQGRRDVDAANHALARLRAECGEQSVVYARLCDAHLPSARFAWEALASVSAHASPRIVADRPLIRRIYTTPIPVLRPRDIQHVQGPYVLSGAWWRGGVHRDYYFMHTANDELRWTYYDHRRQRFYLQGRVE